ncbi:hypothetical protein, partial [Pseudomonas amygdali]
ENGFLSFILESTSISLPRMPIRTTVCAGATLITLGTETMPAMLWAAKRGLKWQAVKMRRLRGDSWHEALEPELRRTTFMSRWHMSKR